MTKISEHAIIRGDVVIGKNTLVEPFAIITGPCTIGSDCYIGAGAVIGAAAQHTGSYPHPIVGEHDPCGVVVGDGVCIREYVTVHQGLMLMTSIRDRCLLMVGCHVGHDTIIRSDTVIAPFTSLGGFTSVGEHVTFGQSCVVHPWIVIGSGAMIGLNSSVIRDVAPLEKVAGCPAERLGGQNDRKREAIAHEINGDHAFARQVTNRDRLKQQWYKRRNG